MLTITFLSYSLNKNRNGYVYIHTQVKNDFVIGTVDILSTKTIDVLMKHFFSVQNLRSASMY